MNHIAVAVVLIAGVSSFFSPDDSHAVSIIQDITPEIQLDHGVAFFPASNLAIPRLSKLEDEQLDLLLNELYLPLLDIHDLKTYQTSVKNQNPRGSCVAQAYSAALEAAYIRQYGLHAENQLSGGFDNFGRYSITNDCSLACITPECLSGCQEFDLSEEYLIHLSHSVQSTYRPSLAHENILSLWSVDAKSVTDGEWIVGQGIATPREHYAPYFGDANNGLFSFGTYHAHNDLAAIAEDHGIRTKTINGFDWVDGDFYRQNPSALTQEMVDGYEYDPRHIPLISRQKALYAATSLQRLSQSDARNITTLETFLANAYEVRIGLGLGKLDCGSNGRYDDNSPVENHVDGNVICRYPVTAASFSGCTIGHNTCVVANCTGLWEGCDAELNYHESGHAMLLIGYDRTNELLLLKNSWGNRLPYVWVPYQFVREKGLGGYVILDIRDPLDGPQLDTLWIGRWRTDDLGTDDELIIRRTAPLDRSGDPVVRIGSYYDGTGIPRLVTGQLAANIDLLHLNVDFSRPEPPPFTEATAIPQNGAPIQLAMYYDEDHSTFGKVAAGTITLDGTKEGIVFTRPGYSIDYPTDTGSFTLEKWKETPYRLFFNDGSEATFEVTHIDVDGTAPYYSSSILYNGDAAAAAIDKDHPRRLFFFGAQPDLYHTQQGNRLSGRGVYALPALETNQSPITVYDFENSGGIQLHHSAEKAVPLSIFNDPFTKTVQMGVGLLPFTEPVDIYLGVQPTPIADQIFLIRADHSLQPLADGWVKFRDGWTAPLDERVLMVPQDSLPSGTYHFYLMVTPAGDASAKMLWHTEYTKLLLIPLP